MSKLNENLDPNNPHHKIVMELNNENEKLYGPYHEKCGLYMNFCRCNKGNNYIPGKTYLINSDLIETLDDVKLVIKNMNPHFTPNSSSSFEEIKHLLIDKNPNLIPITNE